jgi:hypothetical protein
MFLFHVPPAPHLIAVQYFKNRSLHPHTIYVAPPPIWMPKALRSKRVLQLRCSTEPISPPSAVRGPNPATHPDKVDITAALHMASLVDAYRSHQMSSASNPRLHPRDPLQQCPGHVSTHLRSRWTFGLQEAQTLPALSAVTFRLPLHMLQVLPCFGVAISPNPPRPARPSR